MGWALATALAALCLSGCGGGGGDKGAEKAAPKAEPTMTAACGNKTVRIYEYKGADLSGMDGKYGNDIVTYRKGIYFIAKNNGSGTEDFYLYGLKTDGETVTELKQLAPAYKQKLPVFTDGTDLYFYQKDGSRGAFSSYNGTSVKKAGNLSDQGQIIRGAADRRDYVYQLDSKELTLQKSQHGRFTKEGNLSISAPSLRHVIHAEAIRADQMSIYVKGTASAGGKQVTAVAEFSTQGHQKYLFQGYDIGYMDGYGGTAITSDYVVFATGHGTDGKYPYKVYDKMNGKVIGEFTLDFAGTRMDTLDKNQILILSATTNKLYRMEL